MATNTKKETESTEATANTAEAVTDDQDEVTEILSLQDELDQAKVDYDAKRAKLLDKLKTENATVAIDKVTEVANVIVPEILFQVGRRGQRLNNFTIRFNGKAEKNEQVKIITGAVRMSSAEFETFKVENKEKIEAAVTEETEAVAGDSDSDDSA